MENSKVLPNIRIRKITLTNFRNIAYAEVNIPGGKLDEYTNGESSVLGLYGQNGSGKTSLLLAIKALKTALCGAEFLFGDFASCIRSGCKSTRLEFEMSAYNEKGAEFEIFYAFSLSIDESETGIETRDIDINDSFEFMGFGKIFSDKGKDKITSLYRPKDRRIIVSDELLQFASVSPEKEKSNKQVLIDTSEEACAAVGENAVFGNKTKYEQFTANCEDNVDKFLYDEKLTAKIKSTSFIFSPAVLKTLIKGSNKVSYKLILHALAEYGENYLFVILMDVTATNNLRVLPMALWFDTGEDGAVGMLYSLSLYEHCKAHEKLFPILEYGIKKTSQVISTIVPGLSIEIEEVGKEITKDGEKAIVFDLISVRNGTRIPLSYESDGIRRIMSILSLMIAAYNNPSVTIAIDEMDSGIFEYMLGELLSIMKESAKGQLIFTSHNLRPLEVLPYKNLLFTTVNPEKRFAKLEGISGNNNLRDSYFRSIVLGSGKDAFYDATDTFAIEQALFNAALPSEE